MPGPGKVTSGTRGQGFLDIHLNATTHWKDIPEPVWNYTLGGYQVLKKWLSYRESALLARPPHFSASVRRSGRKEWMISRCARTLPGLRWMRLSACKSFKSLWRVFCDFPA